MDAFNLSKRMPALKPLQPHSVKLWVRASLSPAVTKGGSCVPAGSAASASLPPTSEAKLWAFAT
eukprot:6640748-Prymnesium_polylepis.1